MEEEERDMEGEREERDEKLFEVLVACHELIEEHLTYLTKESSDISKEISEILTAPSERPGYYERFTYLELQIIAIYINISFLKKLKVSFDSFFNREEKK